MSKRSRVDVNTPGVHIGDYWYPVKSLGYKIVKQLRNKGLRDSTIVEIIKYEKSQGRLK